MLLEAHKYSINWFESIKKTTHTLISNAVGFIRAAVRYYVRFGHIYSVGKSGTACYGQRFIRNRPELVTVTYKI